MDENAPAEFLIRSVRKPWVFRPVALDESVPFEIQSSCPACGAEFFVLCSFFSGGGERRMRIGGCPVCGWMGYADRPSRSWIADFYRERWDPRAAGDAQASRREPEQKIHSLQYHAVHMIERISPLPLNRTVCDVGCGYGRELREFEKMGFRSLVCVEHSPQRCERVQDRYGYPCFSGALEDPSVQESLRPLAPIGVFFSSHVLEHTYDPRATLAAMSQLQNVGDYLILAVPNGEEEPIRSVLFWLPHLHSFTRISLGLLLRDVGYEIVADDFSYFNNITVLARKSSRPALRHTPPPEGCGGRLRARMQSFFPVTRLSPRGLYAMTWKGNGTGNPETKEIMLPEALDHGWLFGERQYRRINARLFGKFEKNVSLAVSGVSRRFIDPRESPFEIQFSGPIQLFVYNR